MRDTLIAPSCAAIFWATEYLTCPHQPWSGFFTQSHASTELGELGLGLESFIATGRRRWRWLEPNLPVLSKGIRGPAPLTLRRRATERQTVQTHPVSHSGQKRSQAGKGRARGNAAGDTARFRSTIVLLCSGLVPMSHIWAKPSGSTHVTVSELCTRYRFGDVQAPYQPGRPCWYNWQFDGAGT